MAKLKSGTRIYGTATIDTSVVVGSAVTLSSSGIQVAGVVTATSFSGTFSGAVSSASYATSSGVSTNVSGGIASVTSLTVNGSSTLNGNLNVNGALTIGGTSVILNAATLQISDRDIVLGITTDANNNDVSTDITANHGGIAVASTVGSPILNIPLQVGVNSNPTTYKQWMWIKQGNYSGMGTDAWVSNYAVSIGNTATLQYGSRLTVGAGFTVYDTYLDALDIRNRNLNVSGITTLGVTTATNLTSQQLNVSGITTLGVTTATNLTSQQLNVSGISTLTQISAGGTVGTAGSVLSSTGSGLAWVAAATAAAGGGGGSGKFDTTIDNVLYVQPTGTLDMVGVGTTTTQITTLPAGSNKYIIHSIHVTNISNGDAEITAGFIINGRNVPASISVGAGLSGSSGINTITVSSGSSITVGMAVTGTGNVGETTGIGSTAGFQYNTYVTSVDGNSITLSKPMSGRATGILYFSPVSKVASRLPVPVGSAVELMKQPMVLNALDSIVLQSTGAGSGIGSTSTAAISQTANSAILTVSAGAAITNFITAGQLIQGTGSNTGIQTNTFVGVGYTPGSLSIPMTRPATSTLSSQVLSFTEVVVPQDGALQTTIVYQSSTDTAYQNGTGTVAGISSNTTSVTAGLSTIPIAYYGTGNTYPSVIQSIKVSNISDGSIYPGGDYPVWVGIGNADTIFSWLAYNMVIPKNSSIELCEAPKRLGIGQSIFAYASTPYTIEIQVAGKQKTS